MTETEADFTGAAGSLADVRAYKIVDPMDGTGRMTVRSADAADLTVVDCIDELVGQRLEDLSRGATVRLELTPTPRGEGYVATRLLPGSLPVM